MGVILDRKLLWIDHVRHKINSAKQYSARLLTVVKSTWNLNPHALRMLYRSVIESHILYACPIWISALRKKNIQRMLRSAQRSCMIIISKSFNTAQTHVVTALAGVLPMDLRALELSILRYGKNGRPQNWPRISSPTLNGISYSAHHTHYTDQIIANFLGLSFNDLGVFQPFHIDRKSLNEFLYAKWFDEFKNSVSTWPANFFENKEDLISASKIPPNSRLTQLITGHSRLLHFSK